MHKPNVEEIANIISKEGLSTPISNDFSIQKGALQIAEILFKKWDKFLPNEEEIKRI